MTYFQEVCLLRLARSKKPVELVGTAMVPQSTFEALRRMTFVVLTNGRVLLTPSGHERVAEIQRKYGRESLG